MVEKHYRCIVIFMAYSPTCTQSIHHTQWRANNSYKTICTHASDGNFSSLHPKKPKISQRGCRFTLQHLKQATELSQHRTFSQPDDQQQITGNSQHLLHRLLPPEREQHYSLRERSHNYQLPERTTLLKDKTSSLECCINLEIDCHNTPLTFISQCKLDSVFACHFNKILCYVMLSGKRTWCTYKQPWTSRQWKRTAMLSS